MKLLFECATGKDWKIVMYEVYDVVPGFAFPYFFFHYFLCVYILCNLFVAVIIDTFNSAGRELPCTPDHMEVFQNCTHISPSLFLRSHSPVHRSQAGRRMRSASVSC